MSEHEDDQIAPEELEDQDAEELPDREVMSVIIPGPDGDIIPLPSERDPYEIIVEPRDPRTQNLEE